MNPAFDIAIGPADGLRHLDVGANVAHELALEVGHRGEDATVDHLPLDLGKPDLHLVQPGGISRREVELHFGIRLEESFHGGSVSLRSLTLAAEAEERELERGLIGHIRDFLLELGVGFSFVGSQYPLEVGGQEFRLDLLFYHLRLRAFVAVELKTGEFQPEFSGKMNFYLSAIDDLLRQPDDKASIGIILCKSKNKVVAEYALRDLRKPMGVSEYRLTYALPKPLRGSLPTVEELQSKLKAKTAK